MSASDDDGQQRFALGFLLILITLLVGSVVTGAVLQQRGKARAKALQTVAAPAAAQVLLDEAMVVVQGGVVKFYFATGQADLAPGAKEALAQVIQGVLQGKKAVVSGFHDASGDLAANEALAKRRAQAVRDTLKALGVTDEGVELKKPEQTLADGPAAEARRVEVQLQP